MFEECMDDEARYDYERELKILQDINHPFCLKFVEELKPYESIKRPELCIITEYYPHGDLYELMDKQKTFTEEEVLQFLTMLLL